MTTFYQINGVPFENYFIRKQLFPTNAEGGLWLWGFNSYGQLGINDTITRSSPVQLLNSAEWKYICNSGFTTLAIKTNDTLWGWGYNWYGQIGDGTIIGKSSPVQIAGVNSDWKSISASVNHSVGIKKDNTLWTWGDNYYGQMGRNLSVGSLGVASTPVQTISGGTNWVSASCGGNFTVAIKTDGTLWSWGFNNNGELGDNSRINRSSPVQIMVGTNTWTFIACSVNSSAAIKTDGTLWTWGINTYGRLGDNTSLSRSSPIQIGLDTNWQRVICNTSISIIAIKVDKSIWAWGNNKYGQLGNGDTINRSSPIQLYLNGANWKTISAGAYATFFIKYDGSLWGCGANSYGVLGNDVFVHRSSPIQIGTDTNWKLVYCGSYYTVGAIKDNF